MTVSRRRLLEMASVPFLLLLPKPGLSDSERPSIGQRTGAPEERRAVGLLTGQLTAVTIRNSGEQALPAGSYLSFGHAFRRGDVPPTKHVELCSADGFTVASQQYDNEAASHNDGSLSYAVFGFKSPAAIPAGESAEFRLCSIDGPKRQLSSSLTTAPVLAEDYRMELVLEGGTYTARLNDCIGLHSARIIGDGPVFKEWRCFTPFHDGRAPHPDLWCCFYVRLHEDRATIRLAAKIINGWMGDGVNHHIDGAVLMNKGGPIEGFGWQDLRHTYHSAWFAFDRDALPHWNRNQARFSVKIDAEYAADALAVWRYDPELAKYIGKPRSMDYSKVKKPGYDPDYLPTDKAGYSPNTAAYGDDADRGELGPLPSWCVAHLLTGSKEWARYDRVHALALATTPTIYLDGNGEVPVLNDGSYPGLGPPDPGIGWGAAGGITNPSDANGWSGTDANTPGRAPRMDLSHWPNGIQTSWLISGDYWFLDLQLSMAVHAVGVINPNRRRETIGGRTYYGLISKDNEVRGMAWAMRDLCNAAWLCPDSHPAKAYLVDLNHANWDRWKAALGPDGSISANQQKLGYVLNSNPENALWNGDAFATSILMAYRRGRRNANVMIDAFVRKWVFGRMGSTKAGGCIYRAFAHKVHVRQSADGPWYERWSDIKVGVSRRPDQTVPLIPSDGCPGSGLETGADLSIDWEDWWRYRGPNSYPAIGHMAAACGVIAGIAEAEGPYLYLENEDRISMSSWATCPRYRIRPPAPRERS